MITRLRGRSRFRQLHREGTRVRFHTLWCMMLLDPTNNETQVSYAIGRAVGPAVVRNRLRRRLRSIVADRADCLPAGALMIGATPEAAAMTFHQLTETFEELVVRLRALPLVETP